MILTLIISSFNIIACIVLSSCKSLDNILSSSDAWSEVVSCCVMHNASVAEESCGQVEEGVSGLGW